MIIDRPISIFPVTEGLIFLSRPTAKCKLLGEKSCPVTKFGCCKMLVSVLKSTEEIRMVYSKEWTCNEDVSFAII